MDTHPNKRPNRREKAYPHVLHIGYMLYVMQQEHPCDYVLLAGIKYLKHMARSMHLDTVKHLFYMYEEGFEDSISRMKDKGWIDVAKGYVNVNKHGDMEVVKIQGFLSRALYHIDKRDPIKTWMKKE
jgi:hypothetical protein